MTGHVIVQTQNQTPNPSFLTTLQATLDILDDISSRIDENTYLTLANNLQQLHNIHTSSNTSFSNTSFINTSFINTITNIRTSYENENNNNNVNENAMYSSQLRQVIVRFSQLQTLWRNMSDVQHAEYDRDNLRGNSMNNINMEFNSLWRSARNAWEALSIEEQNDYRNNNPAIIYNSPVWRILFYQRSLNINVIY